MLLFALRRTASAVLLMFVVTLITFSLLYSNGPAIARAVLGETATQEAVDARAAELGLDEPVLVQYGEWLSNLFRGSLGESFYSGQPVIDMLTTRIPVTATLAAIILALTAIVSVIVGVAAAVRGGWIDKTLQFFSVLGAAVPAFIIAVPLVLIFSITLDLLPATGYVQPTTNLLGWAQSLVLPVLAVVLGTIGGAAQQFRGAMVDLLEQDFVRTLRSRGVSERRILFVHVLRSAAAPGLTILGLQTIGLLGGVVIIEQMFALPGVGDLAVEMTLSSDIPVVMGCVLFVVAVVVAVNLLTDIIGAWLNPKARTQ